MNRAAAIAIAAALALAAACGCGVKSHPIPPELARPARIADLSAVSVKEGIRLSWPRPESYEGGGRMRDLGGFAIMRAEGEGPFHLLATIPVTDQERFQVQEHFDYVDHEAALHHAYRYEIISTTTDGYRSRPSNQVSITRAEPAPPPSPENFVIPTPTPIPLPP
jgi:hypothetical protein